MDFAQQLKEQVDIVRVVSDFVRLRKVGSRYSGLCPFHNEKTASFYVTPEHQFFKCFGCGEGGDVFQFVMKIEGLTFWEALKKLAEQHGIQLPKQSQAGDEKTKLRAVIFEMHEIAAEHFRANLTSPGAASVRAYLEKRGVTPAAIEQFGIGFAEPTGRSLLRVFEQRRFSPQHLEASGLIGRRDEGGFYDRFRNRVMFPIHSESGKFIAFGGRALDPNDNAKYLNSPETEIYKKSHVLYNLHRAKQSAMKLDRIVLVEGYMDVIGAVQAGVTEAVATCGTALTVDQIRAMKRHSRNLYLNFDPDSAGAAAAEKSIRILLDEDMNIRVVALDGGLDPDEYCKVHGADAYRDRVTGARDYFHWRADQARTKFNMREPQGKIDAFRYLTHDLNMIRDKLVLAARVNDLASYLGVETGLVLEHLRKNAADKVERPAAPKAQPVAHSTDRILLPLLLSDDDARPRLIESLRTLAAPRQGPSGPVYELLISMYDAGEPIHFNAVHERLAAAHQDSLAAIVLDAMSGGATLDDGLACIEAWRREESAGRVRDLKARIKAAEREGRLTDAMELYRELDSGQTA